MALAMSYLTSLADKPFDDYVVIGVLRNARIHVTEEQRMRYLRPSYLNSSLHCHFLSWFSTELSALNLALESWLC